MLRLPRRSELIGAAAFAVVVVASCAQITGIDELEIGACRGGKCTDGGIAPGRDADLSDAPMDASPTNCVPTCSGTTACCNSECVDYLTSAASCGSCGHACAPTEQCASGACRMLPLGNGADGALDVAEAITTGTVATGGLAGASGQRVLTVASTTGFVAGDLVLAHQTRGRDAGKHELATIESLGPGETSMTLVRPLSASYVSDDGAARAQLVRVPQYTTVTIRAGGSVVAPAWNGDSGGILVFKATGAVSVAGTIEMTGRGFRGYSHAAGCTGGARYACTTANTANGFAGESAAGAARAGAAANGAGGGGGEDGQDCAGGGGGGHGAAGTGGPDGAGLVCRNGPQLGGAPGATAGTADLTSIVFGGAGGEGGGDEDGAYPGPGGSGGGIVWIEAETIAVTGRIGADGASGGDGVNVSAACGGVGCGMGPGGGGAGGAVRLRASQVTLGTDRVTALGNAGGACTCPGYGPGGAGGAGRIAIGGAVDGATTPAFVAK
jgi:large repetitive protein